MSTEKLYRSLLHQVAFDTWTDRLIRGVFSLGLSSDADARQIIKSCRSSTSTDVTATTVQNCLVWLFGHESSQSLISSAIELITSDFRSRKLPDGITGHYLVGAVLGVFMGAVKLDESKSRYFEGIEDPVAELYEAVVLNSHHIISGNIMWSYDFSEAHKELLSQLVKEFIRARRFRPDYAVDVQRLAKFRALRFLRATQSIRRQISLQAEGKFELDKRLGQYLLDAVEYAVFGVFDPIERAGLLVGQYA